VAEQARTTANIDLVGGSIALDFANTGDRQLASGAATERLVAYEDLIVFAKRTGLIGDERAGRLLEEAVRRPAAAAAVTERARELRDAIYSLFSAIASSDRPSDGDIAVLNAYLAEGMGHRRLEPGAGRCEWMWSAGEEPLAQVLWPIASEAAELLVEGELERVKRCGNDTCAWLFVDLSRNRSRRWCDMKDCGNRAKARRHYARKKGAGATEAS
jgi:predicted RNA-binding Zn ribbon-like protein